MPRPALPSVSPFATSVPTIVARSRVPMQAEHRLKGGAGQGSGWMGRAAARGGNRCRGVVWCVVAQMAPNGFVYFNVRRVC